MNEETRFTSNAANANDTNRKHQRPTYHTKAIIEVYPQNRRILNTNFYYKYFFHWCQFHI